jgi:AraC-like DNA-binding protein
MTVYEQVQKALDFIEANLCKSVRVKQVAEQAHMSIRSFYNYFWAISGFTYKEYVIKRRLTESLSSVGNGTEKIIDIALRTGYESHEAFSRAFKKEFGLTPIRCRECRPALRGLGKIKLIKEMHMGVIVKELPEMSVLCFDGFAPEPENKAHASMESWLKQSGYTKPYRIFGHNIDREGNLAHDPNNIGYRLLVTVETERLSAEDKRKVHTIASGRYVVTGVEGDISSGDPKWIGEGWGRMKEMMSKKGYRAHHCPRWLEEQLEPSKPGNLRLDLYLEVG